MRIAAARVGGGGIKLAGVRICSHRDNDNGLLTAHRAHRDSTATARLLLTSSASTQKVSVLYIDNLVSFKGNQYILG